MTPSRSRTEPKTRKSRITEGHGAALSLPFSQEAMLAYWREVYPAEDLPRAAA